MRLSDLKTLVENQVTDPADLVDMLELTIEDILERFSDRLLEFKEKFGVVDEHDEA